MRDAAETNTLAAVYAISADDSSVVEQRTLKKGLKLLNGQKPVGRRFEPCRRRHQY